LPDDIEAIAALKRIPQTRGGPDWRRGSDADVALAVKLLGRDRGFLSDVAKSEVRKQGGPIRHKDRAEHLKQYVDDPLALVDDDDETITNAGPVRSDPWGADSGWGDIESNLVIWWHEAAYRYDPKRNAPWRAWLALVIPCRVSDYLNSGSTAGMADKGDAPHYDPLFEIIDGLKLSPVFNAANVAVKVELKRLSRDQKLREAVVLRDRWFNRKSMRDVGRKCGISTTTVSRMIRDLRKRMPHFNDAMAIEEELGRLIKEKDYGALLNLGQKFKQSSSLQKTNENLFGGFRIIGKGDDALGGVSLLRHVGPRRLREVLIADPELPPQARRRWRLINIEPVHRIATVREIQFAEDLQQDLIDLLLSESASRYRLKCQLPDR